MKTMHQVTPDPVDPRDKTNKQSADGSGGPTIIVQDEGVDVSNSPHTTINFTGNGVVVTDSGSGVAEINIPAPFTQRFRYTAGAIVSSDFSVILPEAMPDDGYIVSAQLVDAGAILGIRCPDTLAGDRTTTEFRVILTAPLAAGETIDFLISDRDPGNDVVGPS